MKLKKLPAEFRSATQVLKTIEEAGFSAYFVGGSLRDTLLNQPIHDIDIATSAYPEEIKQIFKRTVDMGIEHGTVLVLWKGEGYEVTTFRTESGYQDFRRPDHVEFVRDIHDDLKRRDFTINALAMDHNGEIIDLFNGLLDLDHKIIRAVGNPDERLQEDPLRMMRAFRFQTQLDFSLDQATFQAILDHHELITKISMERIHEEFIKLMLSKNRNIGLKSLLDAKIAECLPYLQDHLVDLQKLITMPKTAQPLKNSGQVWALLGFLFDLSETDLVKMLHIWKESKKVANLSTLLLRNLRMRQNNFWQAEDLFEAGLDSALLVEELCQLLWETANFAKTTALYQDLPIKETSELKITGTDLINNLKLKPGKIIGEVLTQIKGKVLRQELKNDPAELLNFAKNYIDKL